MGLPFSIVSFLAILGCGIKHYPLFLLHIFNKLFTLYPTIRAILVLRVVFGSAGAGHGSQPFRYCLDYRNTHGIAGHFIKLCVAYSRCLRPVVKFIGETLKPETFEGC
jgi:hypothetical protein